MFLVHFLFCYFLTFYVAKMLSIGASLYSMIHRVIDASFVVKNGFTVTFHHNPTQSPQTIHYIHLQKNSNIKIQNEFK